ncbi:hypothetical protein [Klebsiella phage phiKp_7-2]|nr:hypothetical protein HSE3_gp065 [Klebsiella phage vB_KleS-HSE3]BEH84577.1 hypothetical protein [Klebsiella phage phiKp_7-2]
MMNIGKQPDPEITESALQRAFIRCMGNSFQIMIPNYYTPDNLGYEADMFCIRKSRYTVEVEVKISIADMRADFRKAHTVYPKTVEDYKQYWIDDSGRHKPYPVKMKHDCLEAGELIANRFYFLVPWTIADKAREILPDYAGLYVFNQRGTVQEDKVGPMLHKRKLDPKYDWGIMSNLNARYLRLLNRQ